MNSDTQKYLEVGLSYIVQYHPYMRGRDIPTINRKMRVRIKTAIEQR
jgi:hypothetical protein